MSAEEDVRERAISIASRETDPEHGAGDLLEEFRDLEPLAGARDLLEQQAAEEPDNHIVRRALEIVRAASEVGYGGE